ncbi:MAG: ABC transporter permease [Candidatus Obscuribacterales bacterium]|nr:ABC transporter permease [Candidatus Obscuribacterales bacterium]
MSFFELIEIAWQGILENRMRSILTVLGIIIGIAAVIILLAIGQGAAYETQKQIQMLGSNLIYVRPGAVSSASVSLGHSSAATLTYDDVQALREVCPAVGDAAAMYDSALQVQNGANNTSTRVSATEPGYCEIRNFHPAKGRFFNHSEMDSYARVCVLGDTVATDLFGDDADPIGKSVLIRGELFQVIGVMEHKGVNQWVDNDDVVFVPLSTGYNCLFGTNASTGKAVKSAVITAREEDQVNQAQFQITNVLRLRHKIVSPLPDDFTIRTQADLMQTAQEVTQVFTVLLGATAGISLLVGGIGIMNIMLVSVSERTREIGIRKAIGAKYSDILSQFVIEAIVLSLTGGVLGIILGLLGADLIGKLMHWTTQVTPLSVLLSFLVSIVIGLFFGIYPARRAAKLDPIVALRSE